MPDFGLEISSRPDLPAIVARWQREISEEELRAGYTAILTAGDAHVCWRWLLDLRRRNELVTPTLATWIETDFFPRLVNRYPCPVRLAFLVSPLRAGLDATEGSAAAISAASLATRGYVTALFTDEADAYGWLAQ